MEERQMTREEGGVASREGHPLTTSVGGVASDEILLVMRSPESNLENTRPEIL
jgi:hypothetical protein